MATEIAVFGPSVWLTEVDETSTFTCGECDELHYEFEEFEFRFVDLFHAGQFYCQAAEMVQNDDVLGDLNDLYMRFYS